MSTFIIYELEGNYGPGMPSVTGRVGWLSYATKLAGVRHMQDLQEAFIERREDPSRWRFVRRSCLRIDYPAQEIPAPDSTYEVHLWRGNEWLTFGGRDLTLAEAKLVWEDPFVRELGCRWQLIRVTKEVVDSSLLIREEPKYGPRAELLLARRAAEKLECKKPKVDPSTGWTVPAKGLPHKTGSGQRFRTFHPDKQMLRGPQRPSVGHAPQL